MDQIFRLKQRFSPLLFYHLGSLDIEKLKAIARKPYAFETAIREQRIRLSFHGRLETRRSVDYWDAKIVPGGRWLFTLSTEIELLVGTMEMVFHPILRVWSISPPVPDIPHCVASLNLRPTFTPLELCLQPGNSSSDLFVLVNCFLVRPQQGSYLQVLHIDMADESPQFALVAEHQNDRFCSGMGMQGRNLIVTLSNQGRGFGEALAWDWRRDEKVLVQSPNAPGVFWLMTTSRELTTLWNSETRCIEAYKLSSGGYERVGNRAPRCTPRPDGEGPRNGHAIVPTLVDPWNSGTDLDQIALAHLEDETLRIDMENLGSGLIKFTSYRKDNMYMQDPEDASSPYGNEHEIASDFVKTVSEHLMDLSSSGRLTYYLAAEGGHEEGECISYGVYDTAPDGTATDGLVADQRFPFICPFSGIVGSVAATGHLFIWRLE
ncbi:hypothetical protein FS837_008190 [Tulasnella sp. UAMH 9824]|nr:hypothetical protein FS837_008190 [Tulasnella sp. UAMH 9824]